MKPTTLMLTLLVTIPGLARAHNGHDHGGAHVMGTIVSSTDKQLVIEGKDKKKVTVTLDEKTRVERGGAPAAIADLKAGERAMVDTRTSKEGPVATVVKLGTAPAAKSVPHQHPEGHEKAADTHPGSSAPAEEKTHVEPKK